jgi:hypothetical protein
MGLFGAHRSSEPQQDSERTEKRDQNRTYANMDTQEHGH